MSKELFGILALALSLPISIPVSAQEEIVARRPELEAIEGEPGLPRVLVIGDSISIGYTLGVRALLRGKANVHRPAENCRHTDIGLEKLEEWLGDQPWDVIHFNWGLHDLKYVDENWVKMLPGRGKAGQLAAGLQRQPGGPGQAAEEQRSLADLRHHHPDTGRGGRAHRRRLGEVQQSREEGDEEARRSSQRSL